MRISDWSSDVCSSDLVLCFVDDPQRRQLLAVDQLVYPVLDVAPQLRTAVGRLDAQGARQATVEVGTAEVGFRQVDAPVRSAEQTSDLQSLMRNSYAVFCLKTKN